MRVRLVCLSGIVVGVLLAGVWCAQPRYNAQANRELNDVVDGIASTASVRTALAKGADPNAREGVGTALQESLPLWIRAVSPLNLSDARSARRELSWKPTTALWRAVSRDAIDCVEALLTGGADPNLPSYFGATPLHQVASVGLGKMAGGTPDELAAAQARAEEEHLRLPRLLLAKGANPNAQDFDGRTPLMVAVYSQAPASMVKLLLEKGADPDLRMDTGACARDFVNSGTDPEVAKLLAPAAIAASTIP